ncbi:MAG: UDP-3-O-(3-hydroxymyristoyl)glucosamine N-acyltransferase [Elusimicrobiota bacterium]
MQKTVEEISRLLDGKLEGNGQIIITGAAGIREAAPGEITFLANPKYVEDLTTTQASAVIVPKDISLEGKTLIRVDNPQFAFGKILEIIDKEKKTIARGIHPTAVLGKNIKIAPGVTLGAYTVVEDGAEIGEETVIYPHCYIGQKTKVGSFCRIYPQVTIREEVKVGDRVIIHSGTVIGSDGYGFAAFEGVHHKIPQIGTVIIEDDVEIGANVTIDRATTSATRIGTGTKIDNLVQIAHNVVVGKNCLIIAQVGIAGSTKIGDGVTLAGQAGLVGHISIGDKAVVAAQAGVIADVPANTVVSGYPARPHREALKLQAYMQKLPELIALVKELKEKIERK